MDTSNGNPDPQKPLAWASPAPKDNTPVPPPPPQKNSPHYENPKLGTAPKNISYYIGWIVIGVIAGVLLVWGFTALRADRAASTGTPATSNSSAQKASSSTPAASTGPVVVNSQPAGMAVSIASIDISAPTWLVVYESAGGKPGNVLGAALFFSGSSSGTVQLLRSTRAGETYFVGESADNGDRQFSLKNDAPLRGSDGGVALASFVAQ